MQQWTYPSSSGNGTYTTKLADDGKLLCNCRGWTMRKGDKPRECTHTKRVAANLGGTLHARGEFMFLVAAGAGRSTAPADEVAADLVAKNPRLRADSLANTAALNTVAVEPARGNGDRRAVPGGARTPAPMLASAMTTPVTGAAFDKQFAQGWVLEEKLDGHRVTVRITREGIEAFSRPRAGDVALRRELRPAIVEALRWLGPGVYDGELVAPGGHAWNVVELGAQTVLVIFDLLEQDGRSLMANTYSARRRALLDTLRRLPADQAAVSTVESHPPTWARVQAIWARGGEGAILKHVNSVYAPGKRAGDWLKVKQSLSAVLTLIGFEAGKTGPYSALQLRDAEGTVTTVKTLGNALLRQITAAPSTFIGRRVVITYQQRTPSGTYRHGIFDHFAGDHE